MALAGLSGELGATGQLAQPGSLAASLVFPAGGEDEDAPALFGSVCTTGQVPIPDRRPCSPVLRIYHPRGWFSPNEHPGFGTLFFLSGLHVW